ncbi:chemotaxis protein CheB [Nocardioides aquiterrae]|uniref:chemotaxis protein CheB n=1 Tax=Nocardioides aquiterrae TaxID=203799 RepID=UPI0031CF0BED
MTPSSPPGPPVAVIVVGASAGGVEALRDFMSVLPVDLPACVLVVLHLPRDAPSALPSILTRAGQLPVRHATAGERLEPGVVLVAPPDHHLIVVDDRAELSHGPQENGHRPAIDVLFRSAARARDSRVIGVVMSGSLDDGAAGAVAIVRQGGRLLVQDPDEALYGSMPLAATRAAGTGNQVPVRKMGEVLAAWVAEMSGGTGDDPPAEMEQETQMADLDPGALHDPDRPGTPAGFGCPDCAGALYQIDDGPLRRYRCRVGHAWSPESLLAQQSIAMESALWMALRALEEKAALNDDLGRRAWAHGHDRTATRFEESAEETRHAAELVRRLIERMTGEHTPAPGA